MRRVIVDTGPIVAILSASDRHHEICVETLKEINPPLITTWPVLTEVQYLLRQNPTALQGLFLAFEQGLFVLEPLSPEALPWLQKILNKYQEITPQLADVSLMYLAETKAIKTIFTLDRRDFSIYRFTNKQAPSLLPSSV
ncbi:PIN domain-containing protein [Euhalothece natronophila Z-M001]|uniref:PIN domain-containing protein n=1 Tax=Euhalothece natronophila Z-M001 TaxID=522448 RepID=A0A5B8NKW7_9CHRO|nr:PIN domain-containing protein [Euhalothece natronophila]QDZ39151.1 PIN domain-containing protein [Euhalothece natronophila Z-M001]